MDDNKIWILKGYHGEWEDYVVYDVIASFDKEKLLARQEELEKEQEFIKDAISEVNKEFNWEKFMLSGLELKTTDELTQFMHTIWAPSSATGKPEQLNDDGKKWMELEREFSRLCEESFEKRIGPDLVEKYNGDYHCNSDTEYVKFDLHTFRIVEINII